MRVSFDSNAWEKIFDSADRQCEPIRSALAARKLQGFICETGFRIEAIRKRDRPPYFAQPYMGSQSHGIVERDGRLYFHMLFGPDDSRHPGLPSVQADKLNRALASGIQLMRGLAWMGLPSPQEILDPTIFVQESKEAAREREQRQHDISTLIDARGVGQVMFEAAGGWSGRVGGSVAENRLQKACAEWADSELVIAHLAYQNDVLCTNDRARAAGRSIFDANNRRWLVAEHRVAFRTVEELIRDLRAKEIANTVKENTPSGVLL